MIYRRWVKPAGDFFVALVALLVVSPVLLITLIVLAWFNRGKVFFVQKRPGKDEKIFSLIKFKTMNDATDHQGQLLSDEKRLTRAGAIVRKFSLDELPQLINIIKGDMSFIGPRPLLVDYLPYYDERQKRRHTVKPGITGWAQVNGRNLLNWDKRFEHDVWYVENQSILLDLKIVFKTIVKVFKREGITAEGHATMPTFIEFVKSQRQP